MRTQVVLLAVLSLILSRPAGAAGGDGAYSVANIPASLLKNAHVVKRMEVERFDLKNPGEAVYSIKYALTILDEAGDDYAEFAVHYDKFQSIRSIDATLYDANGKEVRSLKARDIQDKSGVSENNLIDDDRMKEHNFYCRNYPYTVEYSYEMKFTGTMFYPFWMPLQDEHVAVQSSQFIFTCPADYQFRFKAFNYTGQPVQTQEKDRKVFTWQVGNLPAVTLEPYAPELRFLTTYIVFGPTQFEMQDYKGTMETWADLGKFIYALKQGRDQLPENIRATVHQMTDNEPDPYEKIRKLYEFMQKNTRYVSVQLGIGGWQPYDAGYVATKGYGDCKALVNYMYSLLKEAGITSYYTVIRAGRGRKSFLTDFPASTFNHVILCVPVKQDTVWLECTNQTIPAGYLGDFTDDRYGLLVDENGGHLVHTPRYGLRENLQVRHIKASLDEGGNLQVQANSTYDAEQQDDVSGLINTLSRDKVKEYLHENLDFATYDISSFDYREKKGRLPSVDESLAISVSNYATATGRRVFILPNVMSRARLRLKEDTARQYDVVLDYAYRDVDTVEISLPAGYQPEAMPPDVDVSNPFGRYRCSVRLLGNTLYYYRLREQYSGRFPATQYNDLVRLLELVYKNDRNRVVLVKKD
ncbi:MAG TPA: DUF3857 and transglutaminase domain-containing protein [Chitinophagaceae bacterium]|nr:DUF3857 and transglutaminase domain-containing protein [Chitinophagaceae bacterium]